MDFTDSGRYFCRNSTPEGINISRAEVRQIRYLSPVFNDDLHYESRPFAPGLRD